MDERENRNMTVFHLLPEEIWEMIIEQMDTTEDVQNFLTAFPDLLHLRKGNQFSWLIGDIMPFIMSKFLTVKDVLSCRLVSKRWRNSVGISLESHPDHLPYKSVSLTKMDEAHFNYSPAPNITTDLVKVMRSVCPIESSVEIQDNPFPSRVVCFNVQVPCHKMKGFVNLREALPVLKAFGHHIWYLNVYFSVDRESAEETFVEEGLMPLFECLYMVPNLRSLSISGGSKNCRWPVNMQLPAFPFQLKTLDLTDLSNVSEDIFDMVLIIFCSFEGLQKLKVHSLFWKKRFATLFPNLKEICIDGEEEDDLYKIIDDLKFSKSLRKIKLKTPQINISKMIEAIGNSPCPLLCLKLSAVKIFYCQRKINTPPTKLEDLSITGAGFNDLCIHFLEALPELKYLTFCDTSFDEFDEVISEWRTLTGQAIYSFAMGYSRDWNNFAGVWDELPKLEMITAAIQTGDETYQYVREGKGTVFKSPQRDFWNI